MKSFTSAVEDVLADDEREARIAALMEPKADGTKGLTREEAEKKDYEDNEPYTEFEVDGRILHAYKPTEGQLAFMMAALGRGQSNDQRFAAIINIMLASLRDEDADYLEGRLLIRDPKKRLSLKTVEGIFEYLTEEWFRKEGA